LKGSDCQCTDSTYCLLVYLRRGRSKHSMRRKEVCVWHQHCQAHYTMPRWGPSWPLWTAAAHSPPLPAQPN
jgi:hypothetical protein